MDSIDITDSAFSLADGLNTNVISNTLEGTSKFSTIIYSCIAIILGLGALIYFKFYYNKKDVIDCTGGFCTMDENDSSNLRDGCTINVAKSSYTIRDGYDIEKLMNP